MVIGSAAVGLISCRKKKQYLILHVVIIIIAREELGNWAIGRGRDWAREELGEGLMRMMVMMVMTMTMMTMMMGEQGEG